MDFHFIIKTLKVWNTLNVIVGTEKDRAEHPELKKLDCTLETVWDAETLTKPVGYEVIYLGSTNEFDFRYTAEMLNDIIRRYKMRYPYFYIEGVKHDSYLTERIYTFEKPETGEK